jgi:NAD(P)-dependent dehydrogenase (short-subunit alcohol dehydrogenase family)
MTMTIAAENAALGITANAVLPGVIATENVKNMPAEVLERVHDRFLPSGRLGEPEEVAAVVAFLCREDSGYVTGQFIEVDGGSSLNNMSLGS